MIKLCQSCGEDFFIKEIELITSDQLIECKNCGKNNMEKDFIQTEEVLKNNVSKKNQHQKVKQY